MADSSDTIPILISLEELDPQPEPEQPNIHEDPDLQSPDPLDQWCSSISYAADDHNCNPFASASFSFVPSPTTTVPDTVGSGSCCGGGGGSDWFSQTDSDSDSGSDRDISCFVTDLFERRRDSGGSGDRGSGSGIGGFEIELESGELSVDSRVDGLRAVEFDSESDCEEDGVARVSDFDSLNGSDNGNDGVNRVCLEDQRSVYEEFDWEEVEERSNERENLSIVIDDEVEEVPPRASEFVVEVEDEETPVEALRNLEWEILLAINSLAANASLERSSTDDTGSDSFLAIQDDYSDYFYAVGVEYDTFFEQFIESESALKGSPPAARSVVENLPFVELTPEQLRREDVVCAVCKDKILVEEKVKRLPCCHYYHGDCIVPWLGIRNTCPVCRYELPTDDPDYEQRKTQRARRGSSRESEVVFNFELFA